MKKIENIDINNKDKNSSETESKKEEPKLETKALLNKIFIEYSDIVGDKSKKKNNCYYQNIIYANKKFIVNYTKKEGLKCQTIYNYCKNHKNTKLSAEFIKNEYKKNKSL